MKGNTFTTPDGKIHKVLDFDEINKMAYINVEGSQYRWVHEPEYSTWTVNDTAVMPKIHVPDIPAQMTEEQAASVTDEAVVDKPKKTKKKTDA